MVQGAFACPLDDAPVHPTGATLRLISTARNVLHGRLTSIRKARLPHHPIEVLRHARDGAAEGIELLAGHALTGILVDAARDEQHLVAYALGLGRQPNARHALVVTQARTADETGLLHAAQRDHGGWLHHPDATGELALREAVLDPKHTQEVPLPARDAIGGDALLQELLEGAMGVAHQIAGAFGRRIPAIPGAATVGT